MYDQSYLGLYSRLLSYQVPNYYYKDENFLIKYDVLDLSHSNSPKHMVVVFNLLTDEINRVNLIFDQELKYYND